MFLYLRKALKCSGDHFAQHEAFWLSSHHQATALSLSKKFLRHSPLQLFSDDSPLGWMETGEMGGGEQDTNPSGKGGGREVKVHVKFAK